VIEGLVRRGREGVLRPDPRGVKALARAVAGLVTGG
jgi:hypothetical protein